MQRTAVTDTRQRMPARLFAAVVGIRNHQRFPEKYLFRVGGGNAVLAIFIGVAGIPIEAGNYPGVHMRIL